MAARRTPQQIADLIHGFIDGTNVWAWDDFESVPIADPALEAIRKRAIPMGPPNADVEGILGLLDELRSLCPDVR